MVSGKKLEALETFKTGKTRANVCKELGVLPNLLCEGE